MKPHHIATLSRLPIGQVALGKCRLETLAMLITGMISARTVNLSHLASERAGEVSMASTCRRLQRFFQHVRLPQDWAAALIVKLSGVRAPWYPCLDRTNWRIGHNEVNILMLAIATRRLRVPLMWTIPGRAGSSDTTERIDLLQRYLAIFGADSIKILLADREFIGLEWLSFLVSSDVSFAIRVKQGHYVTTEDGRSLRLETLLRRGCGRRPFKAAFVGTDARRLELYFAARRIKQGELLITASNAPDINHLNACRKRWAIECLFADTKTRGFNIEDTRITDAAKLGLMIAVVGLAVAWVCRTASTHMGRQAPQRKAHGYLAKSWFRIGFDELRRRLRTQPERAINIWLHIPKLGRVV